MISMEIVLDAEKIKNGNFSYEDIENNIKIVFNKNGIYKQDKNGKWLENGDKTDYARFIKVMYELIEKEWFVPFVKKWIWNVDGNKNNVLKFFKEEGMI